jgi:hypothetical protein
VLALVWAPAQFLARDMGIGGPGMGGGLAAMMASQVLRLMFRPDVLLAFVLCYMASRAPHWAGAREELAVTHLTAARLALGKAAVPVIALAILHALGAAFYYMDLLLAPELRVPTRLGVAVNIGIPIALLAWVEDVLYATIVVLVGLRAFLFGRHALLAAFRGFGLVIALGLGVALASLAFDVITTFLPMRALIWLIQTEARVILVGNAVFFALVLPYELLAIALLRRALVRDTEAWLAREE